jgi:hypothetical protein
MGTQRVCDLNIKCDLRIRYYGPSDVKLVAHTIGFLNWRNTFATIENCFQLQASLRRSYKIIRLCISVPYVYTQCSLVQLFSPIELCLNFALQSGAQ